MTTAAPAGRVCRYCPGQGDGDHEGCYGQMIDKLDAQDQADRAALEVSRLAALRDGTLHPEDRALLDTQHWTQPHGHRHCDRCSGEHPTILVGMVETGSGAGGDIRNCRACVGIYLILARIQAEDHGRVHVPRIPGCG